MPKLGRPCISVTGLPMSPKERKRRSRSILKRKANQINMFPLGDVPASPPLFSKPVLSKNLKTRSAFPTK